MATSAADSTHARTPDGAPADAPSAGAGASPPEATALAQQRAQGASTPPPPGAEPASGAHAGRSCANCAAPMAEGQEWCLACGAGAPGSLLSSSWRSTATVLAAVLLLALGAAAAAYAALNKHRARAPTLTTTVAQVAPAPTTPLPKTPGATATKPNAAKGPLGVTGAKPPKIPLTAATPKASEVAKTKEGTGGASKTTTTASPTHGSTTGEANEESQQAAILLDTNAASTYNPYGYPVSWFGDPALAIDGDHSTAWTAQVNPATAPNMAVGLLIDLKSKQRVSSLELITSTPGMTVQVYGARSHTAPTSITDPAWVPLSGPKVPKKKNLRLSLRRDKQTFTFIDLWISKAPSASVGTAEAPGDVAVNEVELFPTT